MATTKAFKSFIKKYSIGYEGIQEILDENIRYISTEILTILWAKFMMLGLDICMTARP